MKQYYLSSLLTLIVSVSLYVPLCAQSTYKFPAEAGVLLGASNYAGDIVKKGHYDLSAACFNFGAFYRLYSNQNLSWRFSVNQGRLSGNDHDWTGTDRVGRGFSFSTPFTEIAARGEYDFLNHQRWNENKGFQKRLSFYVYAGAGVTFINPKTDFNPSLNAEYAQWIAQDQANKESVVFTIPVGGGLKLDLDKRWILGGEFGLNPVFNDYLDGISISGNPHNNDWYSIGGISLAYRLR